MQTFVHYLSISPGTVTRVTAYCGATFRPYDATSRWYRIREDSASYPQVIITPDGLQVPFVGVGSVVSGQEDQAAQGVTANHMTVTRARVNTLEFYRIVRDPDGSYSRERDVF